MKDVYLHPWKSRAIFYRPSQLLFTLEEPRRSMEEFIVVVEVVVEAEDYIAVEELYINHLLRMDHYRSKVGHLKADCWSRR
jgi:hypothetical protein